MGETHTAAFRKGRCRFGADTRPPAEHKALLIRIRWTEELYGGWPKTSNGNLAMAAIYRPHTNSIKAPNDQHSSRPHEVTKDTTVGCGRTQRIDRDYKCSVEEYRHSCDAATGKVLVNEAVSFHIRDGCCS